MSKNKLGITEGAFVIDDNYEGFVLTDTGAYKPNAMMQATESKERIKANAKLFADAGNTANKCGLLPSELLKQRDELMEIMKGLVSDVDSLLQEEDIEWHQAGYLETARELIQSIEKE